jgi:hypothetical protein
MLIALAALIQARLRDVSIAIDTVDVKQQTRLIQDKGDSWEVLKSFPTFLYPIDRTPPLSLADCGTYKNKNYEPIRFYTQQCQ